MWIKLSNIHKTLNLDNSPLKTKFDKIFLIKYSRMYAFLMIPLKILYDEYIDRPKLSEQKKTHLSI